MIDLNFYLLQSSVSSSILPDRERLRGGLSVATEAVGSPVCIDGRNEDVCDGLSMRGVDEVENHVSTSTHLCLSRMRRSRSETHMLPYLFFLRVRAQRPGRCQCVHRRKRTMRTMRIEKEPSKWTSDAGACAPP